MKREILLLLCFISFYSFAQDHFKKGYFIDNQNKKVEGLIKDMDWEHTPKIIIYKLTETSNEEQATASSIKSFEIDNKLKFISATVKIDKSSSDIYSISSKRDPIYQEENLFLKVLVKGKANLYEYKESYLTRYFYSLNNDVPKQLIYKDYHPTIKNELQKTIIKQNRDFKIQLFQDLKTNKITIQRINKLDYKKKDLTSIFVDYNKEGKHEFTNLTVINKDKKDLFNLTLKLGVDYASISLDNNNNRNANSNTGNEYSLRYGIEAEFIFPYFNNKWSLLLEPTYQSYSNTNSYLYSQSASTTVDDTNVKTNVKYNSISLPIGVRYYYFLNNDSKLFFNAHCLISHLINDSKIEIFTNENKGYIDKITYDYFNTANVGLGLGVGYKFKNKLSFEFRYSPSEQLLKNPIHAKANFRALSLILGYSIF